tara:strand:- start:384 stop:1058 length:675 start_codon:yes stop_codon:yes gene_type:complete
MQALIVAGGLGERLRPLTNTTPKPMLLVQGKPLIEHIIVQLAKHNVKEIILSIGYLAEQVQHYFGDGSKWGVNITYCIEEEPLGTGGAVKKAAANIQERFLLVWGDNLADIDYTALAKEQGKLVMTLTPREDVEHFGVAKLEDNKIISFIEKPKREEAPSNLINAGAFVVDPSILSMLPEGKSSIERDCFEKLHDSTAFIHKGQWFPTDTIEKYELACKHFIKP